MASLFPVTAIDSFPLRANGQRILGSHLNVVQDAVVAIENMLGLRGTNDVASVEYRLANGNSVDPGHAHTGVALSAILESSITRPGSPILARLAQDEVVAGSWRFNQKVLHVAPIWVTAGYGVQSSGGALSLSIGAGGTAPDAVSVAWGDGTGYKLHFATFQPSLKPVMTIVDNGRVGINQQSPTVPLQVLDPFSFVNFADQTLLGGLTVTGASSTTNVNAVTLSNVSNIAVAKLAAVKRASDYEVRLAANSGGALAKWLLLESDASLGIGDLMSSQATLGSSLEILSSVPAKNGIRLFLLSASPGATPTMRFEHARGTMSSALPIASGDVLGKLSFRGQTATGGTPVTAEALNITVSADENFSGSAMGTSLHVSLALVSTNTVTEVLRVVSRGIGIGTPIPAVNADLQFASTTGRKLVLFEVSNNDDSVYGWLIASNLMRHAVPVAAQHGFFVGSAQKARIDTGGAVFGDTSAQAVADLEIKGAWTVGKVRQITVSAANQVFNNVNAAGVGIIEFIDGTGGAINNLPFYVTGFTGGVLNQRLIVKNSTPGQIWLKPQNAGSSSGNQIFAYQVADLQCSNNAAGLMELLRCGTNPAPWLILGQSRASVQGLP